MHISCSDRSLFKAYVAAVSVLFVLYIIPVILFSFLGAEVDGLPEGLRGFAEGVYHYFFLAGVPLVSITLCALSIAVLSSVADREARALPRYIRYLMLFVTLLSMVIWIIDISLY
jgi:hypothetical protein